MNDQLTLIDLILKADRQGAATWLDRLAGEFGYKHVLKEILEPALAHIGKAWITGGSFSIAQAYVAGKIAEDILNKIAAQSQPAEDAQPKGPVVIGNIVDDFHALGRRLVSTFLRSDGWVVHDLGNDVVPATFVDKALQAGARIIGVSAMMRSTALNIRLVREEIDRRGMQGKIQLAVGGAVFLVCPTLIDEIGGDGTASNALEASNLFSRLWEASRQRAEFL